MEITGRKHTLVIFLIGAFLSAIAMGYVDATKAPVMVTGSFTSFFMLGAVGLRVRVHSRELPDSYSWYECSVPIRF